VKNPKERAKALFGWLLEAVLYIALPLASKGMVGRRNNQYSPIKTPKRTAEFFHDSTKGEKPT